MPNYPKEKRSFIMTEKEKMLSSRIYDTSDKVLSSLRKTYLRIFELFINYFEDEAE